MHTAQVEKGSFCFDPFVGTGSILLTCALKGAYCFGTDIDIRVLKGKGADENILSNFQQVFFCENSGGHDILLDVNLRILYPIRQPLPSSSSYAGQRLSAATTQSIIAIIDRIRPCTMPLCVTLPTA